MPTTLSLAEDALFEAELREGSPIALRAAALTAILSFVSFALVDRWLVEGSLTTHYIVRTVLVFLLSGFVAVTFVPTFARGNARLLAVLSCQLIGQGVNVLTVITGGGDGRYHDALILTILAYGLLPFPWSPRLATMTFLSLVAGYHALLQLTATRGAWGNFVTNNAILLVAAVLGGITTSLLRQARLRDFVQRRQLAAANERFAALDRAKSRFFANLSHEFRTPLTLALAPVQSLLASPDPAWRTEHRQRLRLVERNALRLLRLVDDLLELTRAEGAGLRLRPEALDVRTLAEELVEQVAPVAAQKGLWARMAPGDPAPDVFADPGQIERILLNLLSNAVKFTDEGGVTISVAACDGGVEVGVADTGIGIPKEEIERVFDRFHQVDGSSTRRHGGTGIGLALARELIELHHGWIRAESGGESGTVMRLFIPRGDGAAGPIERRREQRSATIERREAPIGLPEWHQALRREPGYRFAEMAIPTEDRLRSVPEEGVLRTILVVEDNPDMVEFLSQLLSAEFHVLGAPNGRLGLVLASQRRPDVILTDVMMPEMNGFELLRRLREDPETRDIPVIMLTARGELEDRIEGRGAGADAYLTKPFQPAELLAAVRGLVRRRVAVADSVRRERDEGVAALAGGVAEAVLGPLTTVEREVAGLPAERRARITDAVARIRDSIDELQLFAEGQGRMAEAPLLIDELLREALAAVGPDPGGRSIEASLGSLLSFDGHRDDIVRVLTGLIRRALAATRSAGIARIETRDGPHPWITVTVSDEGPGIPDTHAERIFQPYHRTEELPSLGLALWRRIAEAHGGDLQLERSARFGATFVLRLPART